MYSDCFLHLTVHNMFCNHAGAVLILFFSFWSLYALINMFFYGTKGKRTQCLIGLTGVAMRVGKKPQTSSAPFFGWCLFLFTKNMNILFTYCNRLLFQMIKLFSTRTLRCLPCVLWCFQGRTRSLLHWR